MNIVTLLVWQWRSFQMIAMMYYEWAKVEGKVKKVVESVEVKEAIELFNEQVKILKRISL